MYKLRLAINNDIELLKKYKLDTIFEYAHDLSSDEKIKIRNYVDVEVPKMLNSYKMILDNDKIIGAVCAYVHEDGILLDEIYIEKAFRSNGIGTKIIKEIIDNNKVVYLWVYKENKQAIKLYESLGFVIKQETKTRYYMKTSK